MTHLPKANGQIRNKFFSYISHSKKTLKESFSALIFTIITSAIAGLFLGNYKEMLLMLPGLIILVPGAVNMRGTIFGAVGARLSSAFHLGLIKEFSIKSEIIRDNLHSSLLLSIYLPIILAFFAKLVSSFFGLTSISLFSFILIAFLGSIFASVILLCLTFFIAFESYSKGVDPDNVTTTIIASFGDLVTIPCLLVAALIVLKISAYVEILASLLIVLALASFILTLRSRKTYRTIVLQSVAVLSGAAIISAFSGTLLQSVLGKLVLIPSIFVLLPAFLGEGGNIGSIFASKLTTKLHLGLIKPEFTMKGIKKELLNSYVLSFLIFPLAGGVSYILAFTTGITTISFLSLVLISLFSGIILTTIILVITFFSSILFFKRSIDPDNILIPIITTFADILGVVCLIVILTLFGIL